MNRTLAVAQAGMWLVLLSVPASAEEPQGWSSWTSQFTYGPDFQEPFNPNDVEKAILTFENSKGWNWGSSYFFVDIAKSDESDSHATDVYAEWFPSASLSRMSGKKVGVGFIRDVSLTFGINAGTKNTGPAPRAFLPGFTFDLDIPGFRFFSFGTYAYIDERGRFGAATSDCEGSTGYQITPAWSLPFDIGSAKFQFDGFIDYISGHGACESQLLSQPQLKFDLGNFWAKPGKYFLGIEWQYWDNKFGIDGLNESFAQAQFTWAL
jgi:nucleoside-specific outer membrane channel protein Tsx